ncbi:hypothetical protein HaLaN_03165, partial [Haematococcus lacustris]
MQCYEELEECGKGSYGKVVKVRCISDGHIYVLKKIEA